MGWPTIHDNAMTKQEASGLVTASMLWTLVVVVLAQNWVQSFAHFIDSKVHGVSFFDQSATTIAPAGPPQVGPPPNTNPNPTGGIPA